MWQKLPISIVVEANMNQTESIGKASSSMSNIGHSIFPISIGCLGFLGILKMVGEDKWGLCAIVRNSDVWAHIIGHSTTKIGIFLLGSLGLVCY